MFLQKKRVFKLYFLFLELSVLQRTNAIIKTTNATKNIGVKVKDNSIIEQDVILFAVLHITDEDNPYDTANENNALNNNPTTTDLFLFNTTSVLFCFLLIKVPTFPIISLPHNFN